MSLLDELSSRSCERPRIFSEGFYPKYAFTVSFGKQMSDDVESFIRQRFFPIIEYVLDLYSDNWDVRLTTLKDNPKYIHFDKLRLLTGPEIKYIEIKFESEYPERIYMLLCQPVFFTMTKYKEIYECGPRVRNYIKNEQKKDVWYDLSREEIYSNTVISNMNAHLYYNETTAFMDYDTIAKFIYPFCSKVEETERWMKRWLDKAGRKAFKTTGQFSIY